MSIWAPASFSKEKFLQDADDRLSMICMKKFLKNPEGGNQEVFENVISCKKHLFKIFGMMIPAVAKPTKDIRPTSNGNEESAAPEEES